MSALAEVAPSAAEIAEAVDNREFARLLGWPQGRPFDGLVAERAAGARDWYAQNGQPWVVMRRVGLRRIEPNAVLLESGATFHGAGFSHRLEVGGAHALVAVALTAGNLPEAESKRHWAEGRPDEGFFLDRFGAAVAEELLRWASVWVCRNAEAKGETVLFHLSPGCGGWPFEEQPTLMGLLADAGEATIGHVTMLESGGLVPGHSMLAVLAVTHTQVARSTASDACRSCDLNRCGFRRAPFRRPS